MAQPVCEFFLRGNCRYGTKCRAQHIRQHTPSHAFASTANTANTIFGPDAGRRAFNQNRVGPPVQQPAVTFNAESIRNDAQQERPIWRLSSYGPGKEEPCLVQGVDISMEEARCQFYEDMKKTGGTANYQAFINQATNTVDSIFAQLAKDPHSALERAKRNKIEYEQTGKIPTSSTTPSLPQQSAFLTPPRTAGGVGVFGQSAFGQNLAPQSAFGPTPNAFGQAQAAQTPQPTSAFPSAFGQTAFNQTPPQAQQPFASAFPASTNNSAFATPQPPISAFGTPRPPISAFASPSVFGTNATPQQPSAFGNASVFASPQAFGISPSGSSAPSFGTPVEPDILSEMDLPPAEREAFLAPTFQLQCIPETPPPQNLRNGTVDANWNG